MEWQKSAEIMAKIVNCEVIIYEWGCQFINDYKSQKIVIGATISDFDNVHGLRRRIKELIKFKRGIIDDKKIRQIG